MIIPDQNREEQTAPNFPTQAQIDAFNDLYQECQDLQAENTRWRERYYNLEEENEKTKAENKQKERTIHRLEMERMEEKELRANDQLSHTHKAIFRTIQEIIRGLQPDDSTFTIIHLAELSNRTAISTSQVKRIIDELYEWGLITKETIKWREGKVWKSEMKIKIGGQAKQRAKDIKTTRKKPGGDQTCHKCGSKNIEPSVYQCKDCGHYGHYN